jgi:hypothetical protein
MQDKHIEEITRLMQNAIGEDIKLNEKSRPAIRKTLLLPKSCRSCKSWYQRETPSEIIEAHHFGLISASLQDSLLENSEFFSALTAYIEPLKDGALPSLTIQKSILTQLARVSPFTTVDRQTYLKLTRRSPV